jgi:hypothetical protein
LYRILILSLPSGLCFERSFVREATRTVAQDGSGFEYGTFFPVHFCSGFLSKEESRFPKGKAGQKTKNEWLMKKKKKQNEVLVIIFVTEKEMSTEFY